MSDRIKELAEQAGVSFHHALGATYTYGKLYEILERFAQLVRDDEREACAKLCEDFEPESFYLGQLKNAAAAIRARSKHD
jgi:hypothetical protein